MNDLKFALRQLLKSPGFTAVAVLSLALGIAANTTIFGFVNALLFRPPAVVEADSLWQIWRFRPDAASAVKRHAVWSHPFLEHLRANSRACDSIAGAMVEPVKIRWDRNGFGEPAQGVFVTANFFDLAGLRPALGRFFRADEGQRPGSDPVLVVSHRFWRQSLAADPQAIGRTLRVNGVALTVVGVAPEAFTGLFAGVAPDFWLPTVLRPTVMNEPDCLQSTSSHWLVGLARLGPGVTTAQAEAELSTLVRAFEESIGGNRLKDGAALLPSLMVPLPLRGYVRGFSAVLMGAVVLVLLIACANAANLQLARATARRAELAVRSALGASRPRLVRQLLTESVLLAGLGGAAGLLLSTWMTGLLLRLLPSTLPLRFEIGLDGRVLAFTGAVSILTGLAFGTAPALRSSRLDLADALKKQGTGLTVRRSRFAQSLIVGQMALCLVLLVSAALCLRSLDRARAFDPGFIAQDRLSVDLALGAAGYNAEQMRDFQGRLLERAAALPGVERVAWTRYLPLGTERSNGRFQIEGRTPPPGEPGHFMEQFSVGPGYFATLGTALLQGREFFPTDRAGSKRVAIINDAAARSFWPGENPIGQRLYSGEPGPENALEIVGVVATGSYRTLGEEPLPAFYDCFRQGSHASATLVVHAAGPSGPIFAALRNAVRDMDPRLVLTGAATLEGHLALALFPSRVSGLLLGALGLVALVLAVSGLFGVVAHAVSQRTREVGLRMALGADRGSVQWLILRQGLWLAAAGIGLGLVGAWAATRLLRSLLFGISPTDPVTFLSVSVLLLTVAALAAWLPAWRSSRIDPMVALRSE